MENVGKQPTFALQDNRLLYPPHFLLRGFMNLGFLKKRSEGSGNGTFIFWAVRVMPYLRVGVEASAGPKRATKIALSTGELGDTCQVKESLTYMSSFGMTSDD